jgi:hypothetical protein
VFGNIWDWLSGRLRLRRVRLGLASFKLLAAGRVIFLPRHRDMRHPGRFVVGAPSGFNLGSASYGAIEGRGRRAESFLFADHTAMTFNTVDRLGIPSRPSESGALDTRFQISLFLPQGRTAVRP